jgi:hypothetical protein
MKRQTARTTSKETFLMFPPKVLVLPGEKGPTNARENNTAEVSGPAPGLSLLPCFSFVPNNQGQYARDLRRPFGASSPFRNQNRPSASATRPDVRLQITDTATVAMSVRESVRVSDS